MRRVDHGLRFKGLGMFEFPRHPSRRDLRLFGLLLGLFLPLVGWMVMRRMQVEPPWLVLGAVSATAMGLAVLAPNSLRLVHWIWHAAMFPIGWLVSKILLAVVYWGVVTPIACVLRLRGRDSLGRQFDRQAASYWTRHERPADVARYFRPF